MSKPSKRRPGDLILDRYVPDLGPEEREEARAQLYRFVAWQMRIAMRHLRENGADSPRGEDRDRMDIVRPNP